MSNRGILFGLGLVALVSMGDFMCAKFGNKKAKNEFRDTTETVSSLEQAIQAHGEIAELEAQQDADTAAKMMKLYLEENPSTPAEDLSMLQFQFWDSARVNNELTRQPS
jgi:hypothetical protein